MNDPLDLSVYPDLDDPPRIFRDDRERADYVARVCGAWDFDLVPTRETFALFAGYRSVFDGYPQYGSAAFAAFRSLYGWPPLADDFCVQADYERVDFGRPDPCVDVI